MRHGWLFALALCGLISVECALAASDSHPRSIWEVDLRKFGYEKPAKRWGEGRGEYPWLWLPRYLSFTASNAVAVGFVAREETHSLPTREQPPLAFHVVFFAGRNGRILQAKKWPTTEWYENALFASSSGSLVVQAGKALLVYSSDFKLVAQRRLAAERIVIEPSPAGESLLLRLISSRNIQTEVIRTSDLSLRAALTGSSADSVGNGAVVISRNAHAKPLVRQLFIQELSTKRVNLIYEGRHKKCAMDASFVTPTSLYASCEPEAFVLTTTGEVLFKDKYGKRVSIDRDPRPAMSGQRFAVAITTLKGGSEILDLPSHAERTSVIVYDLASRSRIIEVEVEPLPETTFDYALSTDGTLLAVLADGVITVYGIP